jgi:hypothetical protein
MRKYFCLLAFLCVLSLRGMADDAITEHNGLKISASYVVMRPMMAVQSPEDSQVLKQRGGGLKYHFAVYLENIGNREIRVVTKGEGRLKSDQNGDFLRKTFPIDEDGGKVVKHSLVNYWPVDLKPGEVAQLELDDHACFAGAKLSDKIGIIYEVTEKFGSVYGVWAGRLKVYAEETRITKPNQSPEPRQGLSRPVLPHVSRQSPARLISDVRQKLA